MIEFILSATKHSLWDSTFLFLLTTKIVVLQILCPFKNKLITRNYNVVIILSLLFHKKGKKHRAERTTQAIMCISPQPEVSMQ